MSDEDALLDAVALLSDKRLLIAEREIFARIMAHARPKIIERNRRLFAKEVA
jgi:hypothetical protein